MNWTIAVPCWGERCVNIFIQHALPALEAAVSEITGDVRVIVHTDDPVEFTYSLPPSKRLNFEVRQVTHYETHHDTYGHCHRDVIGAAKPGEPVVLFNADIIVSRETFAAAERRIDEGKKLIICAATRCLFKPGVVPPVGAKSRDLLQWTMNYKHPSVAQCFWGSGRSMIPWAIYFQSDKGIVLRGFHLHPLTFLKPFDGYAFKGTSLDEHLLEDFLPSEIHVVTSSDELALAELSPPDRLFKLLPHPINEKAVFAWAQHRATECHRWLFTHRIVIAGTDEDTSDIEPCNEILEKLKWSRVAAFNGPLPRHFSHALGPDDGSYVPPDIGLRNG